MKIPLAFFLLAFLFFCNQAFCQVALNAPPEDPVYHAIDIFVAHGLVEDVIVGQRPYSRAEVARIIKKVRESLDERTQHLEGLISYFEKEYARELGDLRKLFEVEALPRLDYFVVYDSSQPRVIPVTNGQGPIDGIVTSFDRNRQGIAHVDGAGSFISSEHNLYLTPYFALTAEPRFEFLFPNGDNDRTYARIHRLYAKSGWKNFEFEIGRDNILWGQGEYGGLLSSANARPLDMIKISNPHPWTAPWIFKYLGPMKATLFVANLGPEYNFPYAYLNGVKWTFKPHYLFEIGLSETVIIGGDGAPELKFWEPLTELFPFFYKWDRNQGQANLSNHAFGLLDFRVTIPPLRNSVIYYDGHFEDSFIRALRLPDNILNQMAFIAGWYSPRLKNNGDLGLRLEYHHTAPLTYRHGNWVDGYTLNRRVIGDSIGPDSDGIYSTLYWRPAPTSIARLDLAYEDYDSSTYVTEPNNQGKGDRILKDLAGVHEHRYRSIAGVEWSASKRLDLKFSSGYERIQNWNFVMGQSANNFLFETKVSVRFDEFNL